MDKTSKAASAHRLDRELAHLKIISRLLGHEMHSQTGVNIQLSRDSAQEIQASLDLFIESMAGARKAAPKVTSIEPSPVVSRVN